MDFLVVANFWATWLKKHQTAKKSIFSDFCPIFGWFLVGFFYFNNFYTLNCPNGDILVIILLILFGFLKQIFIIFDHFLYVYTEIIKKNY